MPANECGLNHESSIASKQHTHIEQQHIDREIEDERRIDCCPLTVICYHCSPPYSSINHCLLYD